MSGYKKYAILFALCAFVFVCITAGKPKDQPGNGFKNLQVLPKDISDDSLDKIMHGYSHALGVHCSFCHAPNKTDPKGWPDFASDDKPEKDIARHMMRMTTDINTKYFNWNNSARPDTINAVTCATCHRGNPHPDEVQISGGNGMPPPPPPPGAPNLMPVPNGQPSQH
jgi:hypothetical protein